MSRSIYSRQIKLILMALFALISQPFLFSALLLTPLITYILKSLIILLLLPETITSAGIKRVLPYIGCVFLYCFLSLVNHPEYWMQLTFFICDALFIIEFFSIVINDSQMEKSVYQIVLRFSLYVAITVTVAKIAYLYMPSVYGMRNIADYDVYYNPLLGGINDDKFRPHWYFAEPSYCGFFLGLCLLLYINHKFSSELNKIVTLIIMLLGVISVASTGTFIYLGITALVILLNKLKIGKRVLKIGVYFAVVFACIIIPKTDIYSYLSTELSAASYYSRQEKMENANRMIDNMTLSEVFFGTGMESVTIKYQSGVSDAYHKIYCECGLVFLVVFLFFIKKLTDKSLSMQTFTLFSYLSVVIYFAPIILITNYLASIQNRLAS